LRYYLDIISYCKSTIKLFQDGFEYFHYVQRCDYLSTRKIFCLTVFYTFILNLKGLQSLNLFFLTTSNHRSQISCERKNQLGKRNVFNGAV
jgi:hypothetical protein